MSTRSRAKGDLLACGVLAVIAVVYLVQTIRLPTSAGNQTDIGPRTYPLLIGIILGVATLLLASIAAIRLTRADHDEAATRSPQVKRAHRSRLFLLGGVVVVTAIYLQILTPLGFLVATAIYLAVGLLLVGGNLGRYRGIRVLTPVVFGCLGAVGIYLVFGTFLGVLLPEGILAF